MSDRFKVDSVKIFKAPGFRSGEFPQLPRFSAELNLVTGRNGSGKTTLSNVLRKVMWEGDSQGYEASAMGSVNEHQFEMNLDGGKLICKDSDGSSNSLPNQPQGEGMAYSLPIVDLLQSSEKGEVFAQKIQNELFYGIDINAAATNAGNVAKKPNNLNKIYQQTEARRKELVSKQENGRFLLHEIEDLQQSIDRLAELIKRQEIISEAINHRKNIEALDKLTSQKEAFPPAMEKITPDTESIYDNCKHSLELAEKNLASAHFEIDSKNESLSSFSLPDKLLSDSNGMAKVRKTLADLGVIQKSLQELTLHVKESEASCNNFKQQYGWLNFDTMQDDLQVKLEALRRTSASYEKVCGELLLEKQKLERLKEAFQENFDENELKLLENDRSTLIHAVNGTGQHKGFSLWTMLFSVIMLSVGALLSVFLKSWIPFASLSACAAIGSLVLLFRKNEFGVDVPKALIDKYFDFNKRKPTLDQCIRVIDELTGKREKMIESQKHAQQVTLAEQRYDEALSRFNDWEHENEEAAKSLGIDASSAGFENCRFFNFSNELISWRKAEEEYQRAESKRLSLEQESARLLDFFSQLADKKVESISEAQALGDSMLHDLEQYRSISASRDILQKGLEGMETDRSSAALQMDQFWKDRDLERGDTVTLSKLCSEYERYRVICNDMNKYSSELACSEEAGNLSHKEMNELFTMYDDVKSQIEQIDQNKVKLGSLRNEYRHLTNSDELAQAKLDSNRAKADLVFAWDEYALASAVEIVTEEVKKESQDKDRPKLLEKASENLKLFTNGRHDIRFGDDGFSSFDFARNRSFGLNELSSGTRVQMLMALRLAAIEQGETGVFYPLFLDEVIANSDDERALALVSAIAGIARTRQVFYFTAQLDECDRIKASCDANGVGFNQIRLSDGVKKSEPKAFEPQVKKKWNFDCQYDQWMLVNGVGSGTLFFDVGLLPPWYLFFSLEQLRECLDKGFEYIYNVLASTSYRGSSVEQIVRALEFVNQKAKIGRAPKVDVDVLNDYPSKPDKTAYWKSMIEYVQDIKEIDGLELIQKINDGNFKRFSTAACDELKDYLANKGFIRLDIPVMENALILDELSELHLGDNAFHAAKRYLDMLT